MHSDVYRRLYATCLTMAEQSKPSDVRVRWLALAKDCENLRGASSAREGRSKSLSTRLRTVAAMSLCAASKRILTRIKNKFDLDVYQSE